jgi:long-subunit fatty acid transport protein
MRRLLFLAASILFSVAHAGSITAPAQLGGIDTVAGGPAAAFINPAELAAGEGFRTVADIQMVRIHVTATATRNKGIDPNTNKAYAPANIDTWVPVFLIGSAWTLPILEDRIALGFAFSDPFVGGGDYLGDDEKAVPYKGHQRYGGIQTRIISLALSPAVGVRVIEGLNVGAGITRYIDSIELLQASDPFGFEGKGASPYENDIILDADGSGGHWGWNAGVFFNRFKLAQVGVSYASGGTFRAAGDSSLNFPTVLTAGDGRETIEGKFKFEMPLPAIWRITMHSQLNKRIRVGVSGELQQWAKCCGDKDGDARVTISAKDGTLIDDSDGLLTDIDVDKRRHSPRRLENSVSAMAHTAWWPTERFFVAGGIGYDGSAVPDFAIGPTNLDFTSVGGLLALRYRVAKPLVLGISYSKFFPTKRVVDSAAWGVSDEDDPDHVDDRFGPKTPYRHSTNGTYAASMDALGIRVELQL